MDTQTTTSKSEIARPAGKKLLNAFRQIATIEGISMVVLVVFSVLKRTVSGDWGALGVTYVGWAHGLLFVLYVYLLLMCWDRYRWTFSRVAVFFLASLIPFAPFWVERKLKGEVE